MPRPDRSPEAKILSFFRAAPLPVAQLVLTLAKDAVRERQNKSALAKATASPKKKAAAVQHFTSQTPRPAGPPPPAAAVTKRKTKAKKRVRRPAAVAATVDNIDTDTETYVEDAGI